MSLKKRDSPDSERYWEFVERTAREVSERRPDWAPRPTRTTQGSGESSPLPERPRPAKGDR